MPIELSVEHDGWRQVNLLEIANTAFLATAKVLGISDQWIVTVLACDDARIAALNTAFRDKAKATNVLSWPAFDLTATNAGDAPSAPPNPSDFEDSLGDIAISYDTCVSEAEAGKIPLDDHICHLIVHSCLHLLGYDHETDTDAALMEGLETKILETLGIADPYC